MLQTTLKQNELVTLNTFKGKLDDLEAETSGCRCVFNVCVHHVFVCSMDDYATACLCQDTLVKEIFNLN